MDRGFLIIIFVFIVLFVFLIVSVPLIIRKVKARKNQRQQIIAKNKKFAAKFFAEENQKRIEEEQKVIAERIKEYSKEEYEMLNKIESIRNLLKETEYKYQDKLKLLEDELVRNVNEQSKKEAMQLETVVTYYANKRRQIDEDYEEYKERIEEQKYNLQELFKKEQKKQEELIENYKRAEKIKEQKDFYRVVLSEEDQEDVKKLRKIAEELHNPTTLYKLIYKNFYERPFNEMIGRIAKENSKCGIYKITNLNNNRIYIGQTRQDFAARFRSHVKRGLKAEAGSINKLYSAMWKEGVENFTFEILCSCSVEDLNQKEKEYIKFFHADTWGYNSTAGNN